MTRRQKIWRNRVTWIAGLVFVVFIVQIYTLKINGVPNGLEDMGILSFGYLMGRWVDGLMDKV